MRIYTKIIPLIIALMITFPFNALSSSLVFGVLTDLPPFQYQDNGEWQGIDIEIGTEISKRLGVEIKYTGLPWTRIKKYAEDGKIDGILSMFCIDKYRVVLDFAESPITTKISVFALRDSNIKITSLDDLKGKKIGVIRNYTYTPEFNNHTDLKKEICDDDEMLIRMLGNGRIDIAVAEKIPFQFISKKLDSNHKFKELYTLIEYSTCIGFSKKALGIESKVWAGKTKIIFQELENEGFFDIILNKYLQ